MNTISRWFICIVLLTASAVYPQSVTWVNAETLTLEGKGWQQTSAVYERLPAKAETMVPAKVWELSKLSAGLIIRFVTASSEIHVRWKLLNEMLAMPHMPATGVSGVDLYIKSGKNDWKFIGNGRGTGPVNTTVFYPVIRGTATDEYMLYLPLYNGVTSVEIGSRDGSSILPVPQNQNRPIVFYGTSIVQGGCASRPGNAATAILGRKLNKPVVNLGFSGTGKMENELAHLLGEIPAGMFIIDCLPNMTEELVNERAEKFIKTLRGLQPQTPIIIAEEGNLYGLPASAKARALKNIVNKLQDEGMTAIVFFELRSPFGNDADGTVDGVHPNDLGFMRQADSFLPVLKKYLTNN